MDSTYRSVRATLPQLTTFELIDLMEGIDEELKDRETGYEELRFSKQSLVAAVLEEYEATYGED